MANEKITMLKLKRLLQLLDTGSSLNTICSELHMSKRTVHNYKQLAEQSGIPVPILRQMEDAKLEDLLQPDSPEPLADGRKVILDTLLEGYLERLKRPYMTILLIWQDYIKTHPEGYQYTQFKKYLLEYKKSKEYSYHNVYKPGEEMQIDYAGDPLYLRDKKTGASIPVVLLCCTMPYSNRSFAMAAMDARMENLFHCLSRCTDYFGKAPVIAKSDNMSQWVKRCSRYEPSFTDSTDEWALYYDVIPDVTRVKKPRDKGPVEGFVSKLYNYVYARLRDEIIFTLEELNARIFQLMDEFNNRPIQKKGVSRNQVFYEKEYPVMKDLPAKSFRFRYRKHVTVGPDYHISVGHEQHKYSVPYKYVSLPVSVLWDMDTVEIYHNNERIAIHKRSFDKFLYTTEECHMPANHLAYKHSKELNASDYLKRALGIGPQARWAVSNLIKSGIIPQYAYRSCQAFFTLTSKYGEQRIEEACALIHEQTEHFSFQVLKTMIEKNMDKAVQSGKTEIISNLPVNNFVRGASIYAKII